MSHADRPRDGNNPTTKDLPRLVVRDHPPPLISVPRDVEDAETELAPEMGRCHERVWRPLFRWIWTLVKKARDRYPDFQDVITEKRHIYIGAMFNAYPTHHRLYPGNRLFPGKPPQTHAMDIAIGLEIDLRRKYNFTGIPLRKIIYHAICLVFPQVEYSPEEFNRRRAKIIKRCRGAWERLHFPLEPQTALRRQDYDDPILYAEDMRILGGIRSRRIAEAYQVQADYPMTATILVVDLD
jgi:hypothetical protein